MCACEQTQATDEILYTVPDSLLLHYITDETCARASPHHPRGPAVLICSST